MDSCHPSFIKILSNFFMIYTKTMEILNMTTTCSKRHKFIVDFFQKIKTLPFQQLVLPKPCPF